MLKLHVLRHAKSSWDHSGLSDKQRPLNDRGEHACALVGPAIYKTGYRFEHVYASTAVRAQQTISLVSASLQKQIEWHNEEALYTFSSQELLNWLHQQHDNEKEIMIVGHNPALTELCQYLALSAVDHLPTCSWVKMEIDGKHWREIQARSAKIVGFITPKHCA